FRSRQWGRRRMTTGTEMSRGMSLPRWAAGLLAALSLGACATPDGVGGWIVNDTEPAYRPPTVAQIANAPSDGLEFNPTAMAMVLIASTGEGDYPVNAVIAVS